MKDKINSKTISFFNAILARLKLASRLGKETYAGDRDLYQALGYPLDVSFTDYEAQYKRHDIATAIIDRPIEKTWSGDVFLVESDDEEETAFEKAWKDLYDNLKIKNVLVQVDRLTGLGEYGILFLGFNDTPNVEAFQLPVKGTKLKLLYVKAFSQETAKIQNYDTNPASARYGKPLTYQLEFSHPSGASQSILVHYSRIIHITDKTLEGDLFGLPRLEAIYNRLLDLEKITGGSAEMYWRGAKPPITGDVEEGATLPDDIDDTLRERFDEMEHNLRRTVLAEGLKLRTLEGNIVSPENWFKIQIQCVCAKTGIPQRILLGSERGELSSSQDVNAWLDSIQDRRSEFAENMILIPFVRCLQKHGILPLVDNWYVDWNDLMSVDMKSKADVGKIMTEALKQYIESGASNYVAFEDYLNVFLQIDKEQIRLIMTGIGNEVDQETEDQEINDIEDNG